MNYLYLLADEYPSAQVIGNDLSPIQPRMLVHTSIDTSSLVYFSKSKD
jgi:hypothetical protein